MAKEYPAKDAYVIVDDDGVHCDDSCIFSNDISCIYFGIMSLDWHSVPDELGLKCMRCEECLEMYK